MVIMLKPLILYEDNHLLILNKEPCQLVQSDKTGDICLIDIAKHYIKNEYNKPGNVFIGSPHRLDRPTSGVIIFTKTSKALTRMIEIFRERKIHKTYWAIVDKCPEKETDTLKDHLWKHEGKNKSFVKQKGTTGARYAELSYHLIKSYDNYFKLAVKLHTGRHHQIRVQLASRGMRIKGDIKYGARRPNKDKSILLHAREISFIHPIKKEPLQIVAEVPYNETWLPFK